MAWYGKKWNNQVRTRWLRILYWYIPWKKERGGRERCSALLRDFFQKREKNWDEERCLTRGSSNDIALIEYRSYTVGGRRGGGTG